MARIPSIKTIVAILRDAAHNLRCRGARRILVLRARDWLPGYNDPFLRWLARRAPEAARLVELRRLPFRARDWGRYALVVPWLQDPLKERFPNEHAWAKDVERSCAERGIPVVNPVDSLSRSVKSVASAILRAEGIRAPRMVPIEDWDTFRETRGGLGYPLIVRQDQHHGGPMALIGSARDLERLDPVPFHRPVAVEYVDARGDDGLYRKYRCLVIGDRCVPRHLVIARHWNVHAEDRVLSEVTLDEEVRYLRHGEPNGDLLRRAARALGFDTVAIDYARDREGRVVIFEPNPLPILWARFNEARAYDYQRPFLERVYATLAGYYFGRAGLLAPDAIALDGPTHGLASRAPC